MSIYINTYIHACMHIYMHMRIHTQKRTHTLSLSLSLSHTHTHTQAFQELVRKQEEKVADMKRQSQETLSQSARPFNFWAHILNKYSTQGLY